jgi:hypothetical protein
MGHRDTVIVIGLGQLGRVFAEGLLRCNYTVVPVNRNDDVEQIHVQCRDPVLTLVAVAEADLQPVLGTMPVSWAARLALLQNELLPADWEMHQSTQPTIAVIWFEKRAGTAPRPLLPSLVFGPRAHILLEAMHSLGIPCRPLESEDELLYELVRKNLSILTGNIAGLKVGGTFGELWLEHRELALAIAWDVLDIQDWRTGRANDREKLFQGLKEALMSDPGHPCMGRHARTRLLRNLKLADTAGLRVPALRGIVQS